MRSVYISLLCILLTSICVNAQDEIKNTEFNTKVISDVENPQYVWGIQLDPVTLSIGLTDYSYYKLKDDNSIWYVQKEPYMEHLLVNISRDGEIINYNIESIPGTDPVSLGKYNTLSGEITNRDSSVFRIDSMGTINNGSKGIFVVGEDVNRVLAVFFLLDKYYMDQKKNNHQ